MEHLDQTKEIIYRTKMLVNKLRTDDACAAENQTELDRLSRTFQDHLYPRDSLTEALDACMQFKADKKFYNNLQEELKDKRKKREQTVKSPAFFIGIAELFLAIVFGCFVCRFSLFLGAVTIAAAVIIGIPLVFLRVVSVVKITREIRQGESTSDFLYDRLVQAKKKAEEVFEEYEVSGEEELKNLYADLNRCRELEDEKRYMTGIRNSLVSRIKNSLEYLTGAEVEEAQFEAVLDKMERLVQ